MNASVWAAACSWMRDDGAGDERLMPPAPCSEVRATATAAGRKLVCMLCAGGLEHSGGIGRWAGYLLGTWRENALRPPLRIIDTRGYGGGHIAAASFLRSLAQLATHLVTGRLGLIHANVSRRGSTVRKVVIAACATRLGIPLVLHIHDGGYVDYYRSLPDWAKRVVRRMFERADRVVITGRIWQDVMVAELGVPREKITILMNAVAIPSVLAREARPEERPDDVCHIVLLGRLCAGKGLSELLQALGSLRSGSWRATLAGNGDVEDYRREAQSLGLGERVHFPGWLDRPAVSSLLQQADLLVLPSRANYGEAMPIAVLEAMAHRVAVVATAVGALPEIAHGCDSVLLIAPDDPAALAGALARLIDDPGLRQRLAAGGHAFFLENLEIRRAAGRLADMYAALLSDIPYAASQPR